MRINLLLLLTLVALASAKAENKFKPDEAQASDSDGLTAEKVQSMYNKLMGVLPPGLGIHINSNKKTCVPLHGYCFRPTDCCAFPVNTCAVIDNEEFKRCTKQ